MTGPIDAEYKEEIEKTRDDLRSLMDSNNCAQTMLTLAWHNVGTNDAQSRTGEPNDSLRLEEEYTRGANSDLKIALDLCESVKAKHPKITYADLYQLACIVAVEVIGGPLISFVPGKEDFKIFKDYATSVTPVATGSAPNENLEVQTVQLFEEDVVSDKGYIGAVYSGKVYPIAQNQSFHLAERERDVTLESRTFEIGDMVSRARDIGKQQGVVLSVNQRVDLSARRADDAGLYNIGVGELERIRTFFVGDIVVYGNAWIGTVRRTELAVTVKFSDGSKLSGIDPNPQSLVPEFTNALELYLNTPYYLGQSVSHEMYVHGVLTDEKGVVLRHKTQNVHVNWLLPEENQPPQILRARHVNLLRSSFIADANWRLGHRCRLNNEEYVISNVYPTLVTVQWRCGRREELDGRLLVKIDTLEGFFDGPFQIGGIVQSNELVPGFGVVRLINTNTVMVDWADRTTTTVDPKGIKIVQQPDGYDSGAEENDGRDPLDRDAGAEEENDGD